MLVPKFVNYWPCVKPAFTKEHINKYISVYYSVMYKAYSTCLLSVNSVQKSSEYWVSFLYFDDIKVCLHFVLWDSWTMDWQKWQNLRLPTMWKVYNQHCPIIVVIFNVWNLYTNVTTIIGHRFFRMQDMNVKNQWKRNKNLILKFWNYPFEWITVL